MDAICLVLGWMTDGGLFFLYDTYGHVMTTISINSLIIEGTHNNCLSSGLEDLLAFAWPSWDLSSVILYRLNRIISVLKGFYTTRLLSIFKALYNFLFKRNLPICFENDMIFSIIQDSKHLTLWKKNIFSLQKDIYSFLLRVLTLFDYLIIASLLHQILKAWK